jgi:SAM-dependent methyltransferase
MENHFKNLLAYVPDLLSRQILDLGAGKGKFLIDIGRRGGRAVGLEKNPAYIAEAEAQAKVAGVPITIKQGSAEAMPFADASFGFANVAELIEHVDDPVKTLAELHRVLQTGGSAYVSVPSRFSIRDTHFHLYFVNWLPRAWSDAFISIFGSHKEYTTAAGHQRLRDMHYYTFGAFVSLAQSLGFKAIDIRYDKVKKKFPSQPLRSLASAAYLLVRPFYFDTFHILLIKN